MPLTQRQLRIIGECLRASAYGPFFPDGEFSAIFGIERSQVAAIAEQWPVVGRESDVALAVNNSFANLIGYPIKKNHWQHWDEYLSVDRKELREFFDAWRQAR